jgi:hypothetical protein
MVMPKLAISIPSLPSVTSVAKKSIPVIVVMAGAAEFVTTMTVKTMLRVVVMVLVGVGGQK